MAERKLIVEIQGDDTSLQKSLKNASTAVQRFGKETQQATSQRRGVSTLSVFGDTLDKTRADIERAERLQDREAAIADRQQKIKDQLTKAAALGGGFFALGRGVEGAGAALAAFQGHASESSAALEDAGTAIQSIITLNPEGFFDAIAGSAKRTAAAFDDYASSLRDVNNLQDAARAEAGARALGFDKQADAIKRAVTQLKAAKTATDALEFSQRTLNTALVKGQTAFVKFRGASDSQGLRSGLQGAGGVQLEQALRKGGDAFNITVEIDGEAVGRATRKSDQKNNRRNPKQKRGPNTFAGDR